jgi:NADPH:quinone reductase-like Zn-dependent oxidoreductase
MKAVVYDGYGAPSEVMALEDVEVPTAGDGHVLVRVEATSVNPADWHLVRGEPRIARLQIGVRRPKERVLGGDVAGVVEAVGGGVTGRAVGDEVVGCPFDNGYGGFAEYASVPADLVVPKPAGVSFAEAATVPLAGLTALQGLRDHGRVAAGQHVMIIGASGGVGTLAVQIAKSLGAEVTGVCSTRNLDLVRSLGADHVVDYTAEPVTDRPERYDVVLQVSGQASPRACCRVLTKEGTLVQISGDSEGRWVGPVWRLIAGKLVSPFVPQRIATFTAKPVRADLEHLFALVEAGQLRPVIDRTYPLAEVPQALEYLELRHTPGKVAITV